MTTVHETTSIRARGGAGMPALFSFLLFSVLPLKAQLLNNLQSFPERVAVGDPLTRAMEFDEGPKGIATADLNGDGKPDLAVGNLDGTITVLIGTGGGKFQPPVHIRTGAQELRSVIAADLNGDGKPDLAAASPMDGKLLMYFNEGSGTFGAATPLAGWMGVRSLAAGDFDGDGTRDLAAAGPGVGVRHFRGTGNGIFEVMGDLPRLSPLNPIIPRPVYVLRTLRSRDGLRDDLLVTHADSSALWILSTVPVNRSTEPPVNPDKLPSWKSQPSPVLLHECQVHNSTTLLDSDGTAQPWAELLNKSTVAVNMAGWRLVSDGEEWTFPAVTIQPGRFLTVFLSGKNRSAGAELHASFILKQNVVNLSLMLPSGTEANTFILGEHAATDVSFGLSPSNNESKWFDIPSPGAENNAGLSLGDLHQDLKTTLTIEPPNPAPGQSVKVTVMLPERPTGTSFLRNVWFSATPGLEEEHHLMHRKAPGVFEEVLPSGAFTGTTPHRVLARYRDGSSNDYTTEVHHGLDDAQTAISTSRTGRLLPVASVPSPKVKAFEVGPVTTKSTDPNAAADLVYADDACGLLRVHRAGPGARRFEPMGVQDAPVRGAPRDVKLSDTNGDGWLDATVVLRTLDLALVFRNESGALRVSGELPTGRSPREAVMADFTGDGKLDAAVINRVSADVSILPSAANLPGLVSLDQVYSVDGEVAGLTVKDFNGDGRDDVMQLHRASGEISIRYAGPDGTLGAPVFRGTAGQAPSSATTADVNNDGLRDMLTANLGRDGNGSISVLLATPGGGYEAPRTFSGGGGMFAISVADFDKDGNQDVVAGLFDCRVAFFKGDGSGNYTSTYSVTFVYESRVMVTGDFDQDGDIDIAGAGYAGDMVTLENRGAGTAVSWLKTTHPATESGAYGSERIGLTDANGDSDPDLIIGTGKGVAVYKGTTGMGFVYSPEYSQNISFAVSDVLTVDLDGDGKLEMVASCREASCINIFSRNAAGAYLPLTQADVPSGRYLASGDIDGDGKPDLVGTGDALWTLLSSRPASLAPPATDATQRPQSSQIVVNEVLGRNTGTPVSADSNRKSDYMEIYNGTDAPVNLAGWKIRLQGTQEGVVVDTTWTLPTLGANAKGHALVIFSIEPGTLHTGFTLPAEGGILTLQKPDGTEADRVVYPRAQENVSWSRFHDGHPSFHADRIPSPGMSNLDNGTVPPEVKLTPPSPATLTAGHPLKFTARGRDDAGIISLSLIWNRIDVPYTQPKRLVLYDDGMHDDGPGVDGVFAGTLVQGLPAGAEVQFYLEAVDLSGEVLRLPESAELTAPGTTPVAWTFSLTTPPALEISEVSSGNLTLLRDELGGHPDYVKVRNTGAVSVDLSSIQLAKSPLSDNSVVYAFPQGFQLPAGGEFTVFADGNPAQGALHAPFTLSAAGDDLSLFAVTASGARQWIHSLAIPATADDTRFVPVPGTQLRAAVPSIANVDNWAGTAWDASGSAFAIVRFSTRTGYTYVVSGDAPGGDVSWVSLQTIPGDGTVVTITRPLTEMAQLKVTERANTPVITVDSAMGTFTYTTFPGGKGYIYGKAGGIATLEIYYGLTDGGTTPAAWNQSGGLSTNQSGGTLYFSWERAQLTPNTTYYYRLKGVTPEGATIWSAPSTSFRTLTTTASLAEQFTVTKLNPDNAQIRVDFNPQAPAVTAVKLLAGPVDAAGDLNAWPVQVPAVRNGTSPNWTATLNGLPRDSAVFVRALVTNASGQTVSPQQIEFRTPGPTRNAANNLLLSEIMYHPSPPTAQESAAGFEEDDFEFIELQNISSEGIDLSGMWFTGISFDFPLSGAPVIPPGGFAVIASNPHAFAMRYGADIPLAGSTLHPFRNGKLSNNNENISLRAADGTVLFDIRYDDAVVDAADGMGHSLEFLAAGYFLYQLEDQEDYIASRVTGGTPGSPPVPAATQLFTAWQALQFNAAQLGNPAVSGMAADPDGDGLSNLAEYAFGTRPLTADSRSILSIRAGEVVDGRRTLLLSFPVSAVAKEAQFELQGIDSTLSNWLTDAPNITDITRAGNLGYGTSSYLGSVLTTSSNWWHSSFLSPDGTQLLITRQVMLYNLAPLFEPIKSRLFRLKITKP